MKFQYEAQQLMHRSSDTSIESPNSSETEKTSTLVPPKKIGPLEITAEQVKTMLLLIFLEIFIVLS